MDKLNQFGGGPIPIRVKGASKSGEFAAVMVPKNSGGMLSAAGMHGGMLSVAGTQRGGTNWLNVAKKGIRGCVATCDAGGPGDAACVGWSRGVCW